MPSFLDTKIEYLKGVGPNKAELLNKELGVFTYYDLITYYPFRYEDRSVITPISGISPEMQQVQLSGIIKGFKQIGHGRKVRLVANFIDETGQVELVWFTGATWILNKLKAGIPYIVYGKPTLFGRTINIAHPEIDPVSDRNSQGGYIQPVYHTTEKLKAKFLDSKAISKLQKELLVQALDHLYETLPGAVIQIHKLISRKEALIYIHFPRSHDHLRKATNRLKYEELFLIQLKLLFQKNIRYDKNKGLILNDSSLVTEFYNNLLTFELTVAQKRVIKEVYSDLRSGSQMNRLLQGDVGSGKTVVAFVCMLIAISGGAQTALMAPTEILAEQHFNGLGDFCKKLGLRMARLTGSTKKSERKIILSMLRDGDVDIIVGTHALLEDPVQFKQLGLAVIDEQHRFGVAQRARLWQKTENYFPHVLVMTATPIPRTLAMTLYGDLDISLLDEMPAGRKPIKTSHYYDSARLKVFGFIRDEIRKGGQVYIVYPLIEESEKSDYKDLMDGYESVSRAFPDLAISIVHGRMKSEDKDFEVQRFKKGETKIMVATTVIEVGVDIPNASVMVIENSERFGLAQLHQLRGRVGRGSDQSYCILMTDYKLSKEARIRIETMVKTTDGFEIADVDLQLRGPGDLAGTQQSGVLDLQIADLARDGKILQAARSSAIDLLEGDPQLLKEEHRTIKWLISSQTEEINWGEIS
ncbi:MAG: ATP-dependent DNA helicase RecG [Bacteroidetes bacterium]|nr:ATP-dependent DNA helicase RecG [Bacteroidota bacterium]MDA1120621.1 ATP-dependent DNA helicase RecG [Bacteroidota bacterium]